MVLFLYNKNAGSNTAIIESLDQTPLIFCSSGRMTVNVEDSAPPSNCSTLKYLTNLLIQDLLYLLFRVAHKKPAPSDRAEVYPSMFNLRDRMTAIVAKQLSSATELIHIVQPTVGLGEE